MKQGWQIKKLGEVGKLQRGGNFLKRDFIEDGFPCIHYGQIHMKLGVATSQHLSCIPKDLALKKAKMASPGDIIIAITSEDVAGSCKCTAWLGDYDIAVGAHTAIFKHSLNPLFVSYYFQSPLFYKEKEKYTHGFKVVEIRPDDIAQIPIPVPPLSEQQRIVSLLDAEFAKIDALKANAEKNLQNAKDLFQAALKKELEPKRGWKLVRINDVYNFIDYRGATPTKLSEGIPLVTAKNVKMGFLDYSIKDFISTEEYANRQSRGVSHKGDILITTEAPLGNVAIADKEVFSAGQRVITLQQYSTPNYKALNVFYLYYLLSPTFQEELKQQATGLTALGIKASRLKEMKVPVLSISEQQAIATRLDALSEKCKTLQANYEKTLSLCDDLKQALLRKAFNGEI